MTTRVALNVPNSIRFPQGGHLWVFINWALGLRAIGCDVWWVDAISTTARPERTEAGVAGLREQLRPFGLDDRLVIDRLSPEAPSETPVAGLPVFESVGPFDVLLDFRYNTPRRLVHGARRSALIDIDPGMLQVAIVDGVYAPPEHDAFFSIGETVGTDAARFPDAGLPWQPTRPCVFLDEWPVTSPPAGAPFTTVAHWWGGDTMFDEQGELYTNTKQAAFEDYLDVPAGVPAPFELALNLGPPDDEPSALEKARIEGRGFRVAQPSIVAGTTEAYREYVRASAGEFSCAKPSYVRMDTAWVSDRTVCYLASGRPCVVQYTGPSSYLPDGPGLHRFRDATDATRALRTVVADYEPEARAARALAEEHFDATRVAADLLERLV